MNQFSNKCIFRIVMLSMSILVAGGLSSCHTSKKHASRPGNPHMEEIHIGNVSKQQRRIIEEAYTWLGTPYKYAAAEKGEATDCSGMVMKVYESTTGCKLPRNSAKQAEFCDDKDAAEVDCGDLVFFATGRDPDRISHVGIVIDNDNFIHASASKGVVVSKFANDYYRRTFRKFGRVPVHKNDRAEAPAEVPQAEVPDMPEEN